MLKAIEMNRIFIILIGLFSLTLPCFSNNSDININIAESSLQNAVESNWRWGVTFSGGQVIFLHGAENVIKNAYHFDVAFELYLKRFYFNPEMQIINAKLQNDIIQDDYIFPKKAGIQIIRYNFNFSYLPIKHKNIDFGPLAGISLNPFGISPSARDQYGIKKELEGFHFGYSFGIFLNSYFPYFENQMGNYSKWGIRCKIAYNSLREKKINQLSGNDITWSLGLVLNVFDIFQE